MDPLVFYLRTTRFGENEDSSDTSDDPSSVTCTDNDSSIVMNFVNRVVLQESQPVNISRVSDSLCAKGDISRLVSLLHQKTMNGAWSGKAHRPLSLVLIDGNCIPSAEGFSLVLKQLANFYTQETRFVFLHSDQALLASAKAQIQSTLDRLCEGPVGVNTMYWMRKSAPSSATPITFSELDDQVMPILVAAPSDATVAISKVTASGLPGYPSLIEDSPVLSDTTSANKITSLGASANGFSPLLISSLIQRLCKGGNSRGLVVAPYDRYGIMAAGAAIARRDFVGLCPLDEDGPSDLQTTNNYIHAVLQGEKINAILDGAKGGDNHLWSSTATTKAF